MIYTAGSEECHLCKKKLDPDKKDIEWFILPQLADDTDVKIWQYSGKMFHYDCYNKWEHKDEYEKELKRKEEMLKEVAKREEEGGEADLPDSKLIFEETNPYDISAHKLKKPKSPDT